MVGAHQDSIGTAACKEERERLDGANIGGLTSSSTSREELGSKALDLQRAKES